MATEWEGKSKGTVLGYKLYIFFLNTFGIGTAYFILRFVVLYYFLFSFNSSKSIFYYFNGRLKYTRLKSIAAIYKSYYMLGKVLTDRVAISTKFRDRYQYTHDGMEHIDELLKQNKGGILISGHIGNFEVSHYFLEDRYSISKIFMVTTHAEHENIKEYMDGIVSKSSMEFIVVQEDMSHIFEIHNALAQGGLVVFTGDRYLPGTKTLKQEFLGAEAEFPLGPYLLATRLKVPVLFVYVLKGPKKEYHLYAKQAVAKARNPQALLSEFTQSMEWILVRYPYQWFNYFDFWKDSLKK
ncbi:MULTISPECIES: lipid A biosynthesis acyltransferase [Maribacter]|uniref:Lipid A biosynthesis acyltransferase n=1 Tax=Maribacter flavus TaxID=1658664 RepID=A0ABU7IDU6_9FLAO|nr:MULTISPECIES: lipid A biosynthesis acyltransferase [Maribacter]MDC6403868.1 lipid A biosynthesis acyltransferase [Maribacter sp. PR66]MEE1971009.1 lipid A biosynthesis acyltransferase [Maribacter flavus]